MPVLPRQVAPLLLAAACAGAPAQAGEEVAFARVGETVISAERYEAALQASAREKFFHRQVPEQQRRELEREVAGQLIERALVIAEARRRGMQPGRERIEATLAGYDARYAASPDWQRQRGELLGALRQELEERDLAEQLRLAVQVADEPTEAALREYYDSHPELFKEPEQVRVALLVLKVDPASPQAVWERAAEEAAVLRQRMLDEGDFSRLADRGPFHEGTLPPGIAAKLAAMQPGELAEPIRLLEGMALVRLTERRLARPQPFAEAHARARELWQREQAMQRWQALLASLRAAARIRIDLSRYPALAGIAH